MSADSLIQSTPESEKETFLPSGSAAKKLATIIYALYAFAFVFGVTSIVGVVMAHIKRGETGDDVIETHLRYQIRTFWLGLVGYAVGVVTAVFGVGYFIVLATVVWSIYRIVKGWLRLNDGKPMY